ncbi:hypothetical protein VTH8203_02664 [Vibrio thalassae]|uniref:Uncharacterized protein n=1 Tax=Vibrio thalassae TaxID=1243014 RepID=A0A240EK07_9VIBR|nr:hypothetical protein [Vibrio thalassae]SNX49027.1 hypothetical protein VTH8203_02664 [Vibrio thalassae]
MNRTTFGVSVTCTLISTLLWADEIKLTGSTIESASVDRLQLSLKAFSEDQNDQGIATSMTQGKFRFDRGYDTGFVGPAGLFQTDSIVTCSQPLVRITSLADFNNFPDELDPFPTYGLMRYEDRLIQEQDNTRPRAGLRIYNNESVMDISGLIRLTVDNNSTALSAIETQFGKPSFVLKRNQGWRVLYFDDSVDVQAVQLAYENALNPEKKANYLNMTPSTVLYGVMLDASFNSNLGLKIDGEALEFFISQSDGVVVFTKYQDTGLFIQRFNTELERCDSKAY